MDGERAEWTQNDGLTCARRIDQKKNDWYHETDEMKQETDFGETLMRIESSDL